MPNHWPTKPGNQEQQSVPHSRSLGDSNPCAPVRIQLGYSFVVNSRIHRGVREVIVSAEWCHLNRLCYTPASEGVLIDLSFKDINLRCTSPNVHRWSRMIFSGTCARAEPRSTQSGEERVRQGYSLHENKALTHDNRCPGSHDKLS
jgi:hypothetical protein